MVAVTVRVTLVPSEMSFAVGGSKSHAMPNSTTRLETPVSKGGVVSNTVMVWLQVAVFVQASAASQVRVAVKVWPHSALVTVPLMIRLTLVPAQLSVTVGRSKSQALPASTMRFGGQSNTGGVVSRTVIICAQVEVEPQLFTAP